MAGQVIDGTRGAAIGAGPWRWHIELTFASKQGGGRIVMHWHGRAIDANEARGLANAAMFDNVESIRTAGDLVEMRVVLAIPEGLAHALA